MTPIYAIGDVHGCYEHALKLTNKIDQYHSENNFSETPRVIWLGDLTDRGPQSKEVIDFIISRGDECIRGNHDQAMLEACTNPDKIHSWIKWGGGNTLISYGHDREMLSEILNDVAMGYISDLSTIVDISIVPKSHVTWIASLPTKIETKNHFFCHAGVDNNYSLKDQPDEALQWIRHKFLNSTTKWPKHIVHGHSIVNVTDRYQKPIGRTNLDYGCYSTNIMCAGVFDDDTVGGRLIEKLTVTQYG